MPKLKPQELKSLNTIALQPQNVDTPKIDAILCMDIAGKGTNDIARVLGMTAARISIIKGTPMYVARRDQMRSEFRTHFVDKQATNFATGDPTEQALKNAALEAARTNIELMSDKNSFVRISAAKDILDRAGYKAHQDKTVVTVTVTEKMSDRFEKALKYRVSSPPGVRQERQVGQGPIDGGGDTGYFGSDSLAEHNPTQQNNQHNQSPRPPSNPEDSFLEGEDEDGS